MNEGYGPKGDGVWREGDWVCWTTTHRNLYTQRTEVERTYGRYLGPDPKDEGRVRIEIWALHKMPRASKAFGQRIDKSPYREGGVYRAPVEHVKLVAPVIARQQQALCDRIMRYPTKGQRDYARAKRRKERADAHVRQ